MAYFLLRLIVYTVSAALVMNVVPGLRLAPYPYLGEPYTSIIAYISIGLVFGALHSFVRPVILFLTGRLYVWSMGLLALITDIFIFLIASYIAPTVWQYGGSRIFSATLGAILMGLTVMALEALFGFDSPRVSDVRSSPFYWRWLALLPSGRRNRIVESLRTRQIIGTLQSYTVDILIGLSPLRAFRQSMQRLIYRWRPRMIEDDPAVKLRLMLQELGPTFVKFGQMAASRIDMLPDRWRLELERLQDEVRPFPYSEVRAQIQRELGKAPEELFLSFEQQPLAAASMGQVHSAVLPTGDQVVVKVQRPNVAVLVKGDLNVIQDVVQTAEQRLSWLRQFGLGALFTEFAENMLIELDYNNEAYQARLLRHNMHKFSWVHVPLIYRSHSTSRILTQERVSGVKISDYAALEAAHIDREKLALQFFRALLQQLLFDGFFHADLHPGNVWVHLSTGRIMFLDMGMMGHLARTDRLSFGQLIWALNDRDAQLATRVLLLICSATRDYKRSALTYEVERLINQHLLLADAAPDMTQLMTELIGLLMRYGLQLRKEFTLAFKTIGQGEAIMRMLLGDKPLDYILQVTYTTMRELLQEQFAPQQLVQRVGKPLARDILGRIPSLATASSDFLDDVQQGQSVFQLKLKYVEDNIAQLQQSLAQGIRRIVLSVSLVGLLLGSALTLLIPVEGRVSDFERMVIRSTAIGAFLISVVLSVAILLATLWQSRKST